MKRQLTGLCVAVFLALAWWFNHRGFLHGFAACASLWYVWSIRPRRVFWWQR